MIEFIVMLGTLGLAGYAEWRHRKAGNGARFDRVQQLLDLNQE